MAEMNDSYKKFVSECHEFYYYASKTGKLDDQIRLTFHRMEGVSSHSIFKIGSSPSRHPSPYLKQMSVKNELEGKYDAYEEKIARILTVINNIQNPSLQAAAYMIYINESSFSQMADYYHMDRYALTKMIREAVKNSLKYTHAFDDCLTTD